jgi:hypothetical protein
MLLRLRILKTALVAAGLVLAIVPGALAQDKPAGVVTTVRGIATVARATHPEPRRLAVRDHVLVQDRIVTGDDSIVRILLGGKALVTVREHSELTITEAPATATIRLANGRIAVAVAKEKMQPGQAVEVWTPNAIAAIRGTIIVAEVAPPLAGAGPLDYRSTITVLRGVIELTHLDPATQRPVGASQSLGPRGRVEVTGAMGHRATTIAPEAAQDLADEFTPDAKAPAPAATAEIIGAQMQEAAAQADAMLQTGAGRGLAPAADARGDARDGARPSADLSGRLAPSAGTTLSPSSALTQPVTTGTGTTGGLLGSTVNQLGSTGNQLTTTTTSQLGSILNGSDRRGSNSGRR